MVMGMLSSIERISLSMRQVAPPAKPDGGAAPASDPDLLILVSGGFDPSLLQAMMGPGGPTMKQVDAHTVLVGQGDSYAQALQRLSGPARSGSADELERSDIWIDGDLARLTQQQGQAAPPGFENVRRLSLGMNLGENVDFNLILTASDSPAAQVLLTTVKTLIAASGQSPDTEKMLAKALDIRQDGAKLRVHFVPPPEMIKAAQDQAASPDLGNSFSALQPLMGLFGMGGGNTGATAAPAQPPPSNGGKIIINGLDDGPRVITPK
jgi:hypothetical protein